MSRRHRSQRGAAAVEFALVVPVLLALVLGIVEFGRAYYIETTLSSAAREGVRSMALQNDATTARTTTKNAATGLTLTDSQIAISYLSPVTATSCTVTGTTAPPSVVVTITYPMAYITQFFGSSITLTAKGVMRCNG